MFNDSYSLGHLWSARNTHWKSDMSKDYGVGLSNCPIDSAFMGPNLWNESFMISDLDNIKLDEFSSNIPEETTIAPSSLDVFEEIKPTLESISTTVPQIPVVKCQPSASRICSSFRSAEDCSCSFKTHVCNGPPPKVKNAVLSDQKTEQYWRRRTKNNAAAKRSRDTRRMLEKQAHLKASILERENAQLRFELNRLTEENRSLRQLLDRSTSSSVITAPAAPFQWL
ncbi:unnamed protein product [Dicrocoelium dendriticum]|nr:unnamed protein product [Dicrocoelium dendriticum]